MGCYTLQPIGGTTPDVGQKLALDINDQGRVALGGLMGPEIGSIEGRLVSQENGEFLLAVSHVRLLRGGEQTWTGEKVSIKRDFVGTTYERRFHKGRTALLSAVIVAGVVAVAASQDLLGFGQDERPKPPVDPPNDLRPRRP
jgi:hypothetical protein